MPREKNTMTLICQTAIVIRVPYHTSHKKQHSLQSSLQSRSWKSCRQIKGV